ncbi:hypothetical protein CDG76_31370 [Nostoc sp. 'Peltigera membranacea cyanobiont' 210A]|nr:hypothetical protein CDG76_31370 [Nostoc sp. 'Peltigera membranacea cyanobiont' 210A]
MRGVGMGEMQVPPHWKVVKLGEYCEKPEYGYTASATEKDHGYKFLRITDIQDGTVQWNNESRKQTEIGEIPESWQVVKLGEICSISTGTTPSTNKPEYYIGNIPFIKTAQIVNNRICESDTCISKQAVLDYNLKIYPPKTVFMAMYGQGKTRGQVSLLEIGAATTQNTAAIIPNYKIDSEFLWQYLMNQYEKLREAAHQGQISHLNLGLLKQYKIAFPSPEEQIYITDILKNCDRKIQALEKEITLIDELFHAMLEQLMIGKISTQPLTETYV